MKKRGSLVAAAVLCALALGSDQRPLDWSMPFRVRVGDFGLEELICADKAGNQAHIL